MDRHQQEFDTRLRRIDRKHKKLASGFVAAVSHDGLIVARPRRRRMRVPFAGLALVAVGIIAFKGIVYAQLGAATYESRIATLAQGSQVERVGAWVMQPDPLTLWVSGQVRALIQ
jgi:hypothetical protein